MKETDFFESIIGLSRLKIDSIEKKDSQYIFHCHYLQKEGKCPNCQSKTVKINQTEQRKYRDLKISNCEVWLYVQIPQFHCPDCERFFFDHPDWVVSGKSYTKRQEKWIFELCKKQSFKQAAALCDMNSKTVERLFYNYVNRELNLTERYRQVRKLGIDEISNRKGKKDFVCVLTDLERGEQLDILPGRSKDILRAHFQELGEDFCNQIETVSCDMWAAYTAVATQCFPNCQIVIDRFHIVKLLNDVLNSLRKKLRKDDFKEPCFKYLKWIIFKKYENCSESQRRKIKEAFEKSPIFEEVYQLRESFHIIFDYSISQNDFSKSIHNWIKDAKLIGYEPLNKFTRTIQRWKKHIVTFVDGRITNAVTEGLNNYLRYFKRISFGLSNFENFRLRALAHFL